MRAPKVTIAVIVVAGLLLVGWIGFNRRSSTPAPVGDPDPHHTLMHDLRPVAGVVPQGVRVTRRDYWEPVWDSCDGIRSTYGWDDVTVDIAFTAGGLTDSEIFGHIDRGLRQQGWTMDRTSPGAGAWDYSRRLGQHTAVIQLLGGHDAEPPDWDLQATVSAATHPIVDC